MGQYAILIVLSAVILGGVVLFNAQQKAQGADDDLTEYHEDRFGREVALVGLKRTERLLAQNADLWDLHTSNNSAAQDTFASPTATTFTKGALTGTYQVTYDSYTAKTASTPELATITALGVYDGKTYTVRATYEQGLTDIGVPPSMRDAIVSDNRLYINGNVKVSGGVHTNNCLDSSGNSFDVFGTGSYTGCEGANDARFTGGVVQQDSIAVPPVTIPAAYDHIEAGSVGWGAQTVILPTQPIDGSYTVNGNGTEANPYVLVIQGDLDINGDVRFRGIGNHPVTGNPMQGHIRIYVDGDFNMNGNSVLSPVPGALPSQGTAVSALDTWRADHLPDGGSIGVYATGDITLTGTITVLASLYANGIVEYKGGGQKMVIGGITTKQTIELKGNSQVYYTDPNSSIIDPGFNYQTPDGIRLAAYREWATRTP